MATRSTQWKRALGVKVVRRGHRDYLILRLDDGSRIGVVYGYGPGEWSAIPSGERTVRTTSYRRAVEAVATAAGLTYPERAPRKKKARVTA